MDDKKIKPADSNNDANSKNASASDSSSSSIKKEEEFVPFLRTFGSDVSRTIKDKNISKDSLNKYERDVVDKMSSIGPDDSFLRKIDELKKKVGIENAIASSKQAFANGAVVTPSFGKRAGAIRTAIEKSPAFKKPVSGSEIYGPSLKKPDIVTPEDIPNVSEDSGITITKSPEFSSGFPKAGVSGSLSQTDVENVLNSMEGVEPAPEPEPVREDTIEELEGQRTELKAKLDMLLTRMTSSEQRKIQLTKKKDQLESLKRPITEKEKEIEASEEKVEREEIGALSFEQKRDIDQRRWEIEDKRKEIEEERWRFDEQSMKIDEDMTGIEAEKQDMEKDRSVLQAEIKVVDDKIAVLKAKRDKTAYEERLPELEKIKEEIYREQEKLRSDLERKKAEYLEILAKENKYRDDILAVQSQEKMAKTPADRHKFESDRWEIEQLRRQNGVRRWEAEDAIRRMEKGLKDWDAGFAHALDAEKIVKNNIRELEKIINQK